MRFHPVVPGLAALLAALPLSVAPPRSSAGQIQLQLIAGGPLDEGNEGITDDPADGGGLRELTEKQKAWLAAFVPKAAAAKRKVFDKGAEAAAGSLAEALQLDGAARAKLQELAPKAAEAAVAWWSEKCGEWIRPLLQQAGETEEGLQGWEPEQIALTGTIPGTLEPVETEVWKAGIKAILTPEQLKTHEDSEKARLDKLRAELADYLAASEAQAEEMIARTMDGSVTRITRYAAIDGERSAKLKAAAGEAVKQTVASWRERAEKQMLQMGETARAQMTRSGGFMGVNTKEPLNRPAARKVWKDAVTALLTPEELKQIGERRGEARTRRAEALAMILIAELDKFIGFDDRQREALAKLAAPPLLKLPALYFESPENGYYSLDLVRMLKETETLTVEQLGAHLDAGQVGRWKAVNPAQLSRNNYVREKMDPGKLPPPEEMDELEVERLLSGFLHRESRKMKKAVQSQMEAELANIIRVANPSPEALAVLHTAARGAAEELTFNPLNNLESWVRGQFQNLKPGDVPARLQNLYNPYFSDRQQPEPEIWASTLERVLTAPQRGAWQKELDARAEWRRRGISAMVLTELEKRLILAPEKRAALEEKVNAVVAGYEPDFANYFSFGWHLQGYYSMIPLAMIPEKEMEAFFDKNQLETVKEKCLGNAMQYVEMIQRNHDSRTGKSSK